jgi:predicted PurR-regulated permease PerM
MIDDREAQKPAASPANTAIWGIFLIMVASVLMVAQSLFVPLISAIFIALIFSPVRRVLVRMGLSSPAAAALIFLGIFAAIIGLALVASGAAVTQFESGPETMDRIQDRMKELLQPLQPVMNAGGQISALTAPDPEQVVVLQDRGFIDALQHATPAAIGQIVIAFTLAGFLLASGDMFYEKLVQVMPTLKDKRRALLVAREIEDQLSGYLLTITIINAACGVLIGLAMWALGLPNPLLFGLAAFVLNFIPYIGPLAGVAMAFGIGLLTFDTAVQALWPALVYWLITTLEGQFVTPVLLGRRLKLNAVVVFVAFAVWAWLWSFMGMLLAMPMLLTMKVVADHVPGLAPLGKFLADRDDVSDRDRRIVNFVFRRRPAVKPASAEATDATPAAVVIDLAS